MKFEFQNKGGHKLNGQLELPPGKPQALALFAHCFTCSKDFVASRQIARALTDYGIGVLRFDFTGLGNSEGDFSNTNFSSNVEDLIAAYEALTQDYEAPQLLIGHSLGGAAVLKAATQLDTVKAVATIGAPSSLDHVTHLFKDQIPQIKEDGSAQVTLEGREFKIQKQFLDDLHSTDLLEQIEGLRKAVLIMHSPIDNVVSVDHAGEIFKRLKHPKSFISLNQANHLLTKKADARYVASSLAGWMTTYLDIEDHSPIPKLNDGQVRVQPQGPKGFTQDIYSQDHHLLADEPESHKGDNLGMNPYELLLASLGACTSMTLRMYADRKKWPLKDVQVTLEHAKVHPEDCENCEQDKKNPKVDQITKRIAIIGDELSEEQKERLFEIAERCPVNRTLQSEIQILSVQVNPS